MEAVKFVGKIRKYSKQFVLNIPMRKMRKKELLPDRDYKITFEPIFEDKEDGSG